MKLSDTHGWTPDTALDSWPLRAQDLGSYQAFWDRLAKVDAIRAIADQDSDESFTSSGIDDAEGIRPLLPPDGAFLEIGCPRRPSSTTCGRSTEFSSLRGVSAVARR
jgi:hypothetical protein